MEFISVEMNYSALVLTSATWIIIENQRENVFGAKSEMEKFGSAAGAGHVTRIPLVTSTEL